jgi:hypothetical protein
MSVIKQLKDRLDMGREKYGHGVRVGDDPRTWGCVKNSWFEMAREEFLDGIIYCVADYIRNHEDTLEKRNPDDNERILSFVKAPESMTSEKHRQIVLLLKRLIEDCQ